MRPMYMDVVERAGDLRGTDIKVMRPPKDILSVEDIKGARPARNPFTNKADFYDCKDIAGTKPAALYPTVKRQTDFSLFCRDIDGATPHKAEFTTTRCTDPLEPHYRLPSTKPYPPPELPFSGRHTNDVSDIDGACPQKLVRDSAPSTKDDIEGSCPNYTRRFKYPIPDSGLTDSLNVSDINRGEKRYPKPRGTSPLDPVYQVPLSSATSVHHQFSQEYDLPPTVQTETTGFIPGSKPRKLTWNRESPSNILDNRDIARTQPQRFVGSQPFNCRMTVDERPPHYVGDTRLIPGSQHGSLKRGLTTSRNTDPLDPDYVMPGASNP